MRHPFYIFCPSHFWCITFQEEKYQFADMAGLDSSQSSHHPATLALHADDDLNVVADVAPPFHLSTTFRYSNNPDNLEPWSDNQTVCS